MHEGWRVRAPDTEWFGIQNLAPELVSEVGTDFEQHFSESLLPENACFTQVLAAGFGTV